jgi:hypothetical protein
MIEFTRQYGRYGYRRVAALLRDAGWQVNDKRVERLSMPSPPQFFSGERKKEYTRRLQAHSKNGALGPN